MLSIEEYKQIADSIVDTGLEEYSECEDLRSLLMNFRNDGNMKLWMQDNIDWAMKLSIYLHEMCLYNIARSGDFSFEQMYWDCLLFEAPYHFESFLFYMEKNRAPSKRFYEPRKKTLKILVDDLQDLEDRKDGLQFLGISLPPRVGKSTLCIFFISWKMGRRPNSHSAMSGHSGVLADGFYQEVLNLITTEEYTYREIFPEVELQKKSAEKKEINLNDPDRFSTLTCRGIDGTFTGAVDISSEGLLYVDDLVRDRTESLSPVRLENRYQDYLNVLVDRKNDGSQELMVGTRWSAFDPLSRVESEHRYDKRYRFRKIPALNDNDESNFDYDYGKGFSTQYYRDMRNRLDKPEWMAKFQQTPFIREGLLFPEDELAFFNGIVNEDRYRVVAAIDPAFGGGDSLSMPICTDTHNPFDKHKVIRWIHDDGTIKVTVPKVCDAIVDLNITYIRCEANNGGQLYADKVKEELNKRGYFHCEIQVFPAPVKLSKEDKIAAYSDYIKDNFSFLLGTADAEANATVGAFKRDADYNRAMQELELFTKEGKNPHDDAPDGITQLAMIFEDKISPEVRVIHSPLGRGFTYIDER